MDEYIVPTDMLYDWTHAVLCSLEYANEHAHCIADNLLDANLHGVDSHGVIRLPIYAKRIAVHLVNPKNTPIVTHKKSIIQVDANGTAGQIAAMAAVNAVKHSAKNNGIAAAVVKGSTHFGTAGYFARHFASHGYVGFVMSNAESCVVPFGGSEAVLGTNPIACAVPGREFPISIDMATSITAFGRIFLAQAQGERISLDWGLDAQGSPTDDPEKIVSLFPFGGSKGYALALCVDILSGVLSGAAFGKNIGNMYKDFSKQQNVGHFMWALHIPTLMPLEDFLSRMELLKTMITSSRPAHDVTNIFVPGEIEYQKRIQCMEHGISIPTSTRDELVALGVQYHVPFPSHFNGKLQQ